MPPSALWWLIALPLLGSAASGALHFLTLRARRNSPDTSAPGNLAGLLASAAVGLAFALSVWGLVHLSGLGHESRVLTSPTWHWLQLGGGGTVDVALRFDSLSSVMALVVTGVSFLIHIYSTGYMKGDPGYAKFFAYLNLFVAAMLLLVLSDNLVGLFIGWEGVGLCSYLLIGFWYEKGWPAEAGQKAFVVNRIGDACFLVGSFLLFRLFGTLDIATISGGITEDFIGAHGTELALSALLLFGGCCGKSAQWPLLTWLPDAMAGPTPVSALIHAATMVTAGVYLVVRMNPLFAAAPSILIVIGCVGALTAVIGATTGLLQRDIKKVLAYSTVSQLGYMFLALGVGAWAAAIFHLVTHAFFKGLLFLGSGSVIHGMHEEQDMAKMGGLRKYMPTTHWTFLCGAAALSGLPLMSGFFSKDEILALNFARGGGHLALWLVGIGAAMCTAFYTWRMVALTFYGSARYDPEHVHPHESPGSMTWPLRILAVLAVAGGLLGLPHVFFGATHVLEHWLEPVTSAGNALLAHGAAHPPEPAWLEWLLLGFGAAVALGFSHLGFHAYSRGPQVDDELAHGREPVGSFLRGAWNIDRAYTRGVVQPLKMFAILIASFVDQLVIDGLVNGSAGVARLTAQKLRALSDGNAKSYALWMGSGAAAMALVWMVLAR
jgi:NADH-quinone oxidoreductase subunit L